MKIEKSTTIAFTGHRNITTDMDVLKSDLLQEIEKQYHEGYRIFMSGMAMGYDLLSAECVLEMREKYADIKLICVIPFYSQANRYHFIDKMRYADIFEQADKNIILSDFYFEDCFLRRNDFLIKHASLVIAYCNNNFRSGTAYTIRKAKANSTPVINLYNIKE